MPSAAPRRVSSASIAARIRPANSGGGAYLGSTAFRPAIASIAPLARGGGSRRGRASAAQDREVPSVGPDRMQVCPESFVKVCRFVRDCRSMSCRPPRRHAERFGPAVSENAPERVLRPAFRRSVGARPIDAAGGPVIPCLGLRARRPGHRWSPLSPAWADASGMTMNRQTSFHLKRK